MSDRVLYDVVDGIADVRLNRPPALNALDLTMIEDLNATIHRLASADGVRVVVVSGMGRAFCAGMDVSVLAQGLGAAGDLAERTHGLANRFQHLAWGWRQLPQPVIAAVHGTAFGGGLQVCAGADIRIAAPDTRFAVMEMRWGLVPDMGGPALWRGQVRDDVLRELTYTNREFGGAAALEYGFVTRLSPEPYSAAMDLAKEIASRNPDAVRAAKRLFGHLADSDAATILVQESVEQAAIIGSANQREAVAAVMESRPPRFTD